MADGTTGIGDILKSNFQVKRPVKLERAGDTQESGHVALASEHRRQALRAVGGSMVYVERERLTWDGD
ncbi:MAG: hypothetical protein HY075_10295 [Deltaproteobacteria bacterium]|nr:hypothetical protein [Deltaproteobacteria bacterium]